MEDLRDLLRVPAGDASFRLADIDPAATPGLPAGRDKEWARQRLVDMGERLAANQERLYASAVAAGDRRRVLLVLQAMDCGGKDGTIKHVGGTMNPEGLRITSFGVPTEEEHAHPFLWRIERALPPAGYIGIFNRSHYEDVLVVRVKNLVPPEVWQGRYDEINHFEQNLVDSGVVLLKIMLHISAEEQRDRLLRRLANPDKHWKYRPADLDDRLLWPAFQQAYETALARCSTGAAPWYVVPADRKWYRDWAVAGLLRSTLDDMALTYPPGDFDVETERRRLLGVPPGERSEHPG